MFVSWDPGYRYRYLEVKFRVEIACATMVMSCVKWVHVMHIHGPETGSGRCYLKYIQLYFNNKFSNTKFSTILLRVPVSIDL